MRLPEKLEALDEQCFADSGLEKIVVPASVRDIGYSAFEDCKNLREVRFAPAASWSASNTVSSLALDCGPSPRPRRCGILERTRSITVQASRRCA